jgi:uncharacterized membrane protein YfcA
MPFDIPLQELLLITAIMLAGAASQAVIGMGLNLITIPILLLINPIYAPAPVMVVSALLCLLALRRVPAQIDWGEMRFALYGLAAGTLVALAVVLSIDSGNLIKLLGFFIVLGVGLALSGWSAPLTKRNLVTAGSAAGFLGTIAGVHGPPIALLYQGLSPAKVRGALLVFIGLGNALSAVMLALVGKFTLEQLGVVLMFLPGVFAGLWLAPVLAKLVDARILRMLVLGISVISGTMLMLR